MDKLEPIRRVFRIAGLYHHAADDLLCQELAAQIQAALNAPQPQGAPDVMNDCETCLHGDRFLSEEPCNACCLPGGKLFSKWEPAPQPQAATVPVSWADFWMGEGDFKTSHDFAAFEKAEKWRPANAPQPQASAEDVAAWAQRLDDGYDSAESPPYIEFYRKDVVESVICEMRASLGVGRE